ncbi:MAG TPA: ATP-binding protein [Solirubrobacteraceae bacterium]|jgi:signal transduction histidine kinase|nr:ATP-binding protein [Solirubrobacteraceae bacterium]
MSTSEPVGSTSTAAEGRPRALDPVWRGTAVAGIALLGGLSLALIAPSHAVPAVAVSLLGVAAAIVVLGRRAAAAVFRHPALVAVAAIALFVALRVVGLDNRVVSSVPGLQAVSSLWGAGRGPVWTLALMALAATGGLVLIADALRIRLGLARARPVPWQQLTDAPTGARGAGIPWRAMAGVALIGWVAFLGVGLAGPYVSGDGALRVTVTLLVAVGAALAIATPILIASLARIDRDKAGRAREDERQRFAAHLHDSVLQTLALVQRQADDPAAVVRLARRQEHALRAWMAGEAELTSATLGAALREVVAAVEDEHGASFDVSVIGERPLDATGEALVAAAREALRNACVHAPGAAVFVFAELSNDRAEVFVRDDGPGFDLEAVPAERRGIRDALVGRMAAVGGSATVDAAPGEGTEVALRIGARR